MFKLPAIWEYTLLLEYRKLSCTPQADRVVFNDVQLETAICISCWGKKSKQRFLKASSTDTTIRRSRKGAGGNTAVCHCIIVKQVAVAEETKNFIKACIHRFSDV